MAKSLRSSVKKANKAKLRSRVFRPVEDARTERLSAKLLKLASKPQTEREKMNDPTKAGQVGQQEEADPETTMHTQDEVMEVDADEVAAASTAASVANRESRIQKRGRGKASSSMVFPVYKKGKRTGGGSGKKQRR